MAGRLLKPARQTGITAAASGEITVGSTVGFYERAFAYLALAGQPGAKVQITEVTDATHLKVRVVVDDAGLLGAGPNYGFDDVSAYNTGIINQPEQLLYNRNDKPLD